jgi:biotin carboxyl carrier protein
MKYFVSLGGREIEVEVDGDRVTVDGHTHIVSLSVVPGTPLRLALIDGRPLALPVEAAGRGRWGLTIGGERVEADIIDERARHIRSLTAGGVRRTGGNVLKAPMPGLVMRILVEPGQSVAAGAGVVVLEAMKMENELKAAAGGVVSAVLVQPGQAVEKGQLLVEFAQPEPAGAVPAVPAAT